MFLTSLVSALALSVVSMLSVVGCAAAEKPEPRGYGYEFAADRVTATLPATKPTKPTRPADTTSDRVAPEAIQAVIRGAFPAVLACTSASKLTGTVRLRFVVGESGTVTRIDDAGDPCIAAAVSGLVFPASAAGDATVVYPLVLDPG